MKPLTAPPDFRIHYHWQEGSVPPPYHYEYDIRIGPGSEGEVVFYPDYPGAATPVWKEAFSVREMDLTHLFASMENKRLFKRHWHSPPQRAVGGSLEWMEVSADSAEYRVPSQLKKEDAAVVREIYDAIRALVPETLWQDLRARHQVYEQAHLD